MIHTLVFFFFLFDVENEEMSHYTEIRWLFCHKPLKASNGLTVVII